MSANPPERSAARRRWAMGAGVAVSHEALAYAALSVVALALRLLRLDWLPLDPSESDIALPAWQSARAIDFGAVPSQPLLFHLERLVFWLLGGGSDVTARLVPAVAGTLIVVLTWRLRGVLGRPTALALAALFAMSPTWVFLSRQVSAATVSTAFVVLLLGALAGESRWDRDLAPIAAALAIVAGGVAYTFALAVVAYGVVAALRGELRDHLTILSGKWPEAGDRRRALAVFGGAIVLAATGLLSRPDGFAALVQSPAGWAAALVSAPMGFGEWVALPMLVYAPVTLVFGLAGIVLALRRSRRGGAFLALWCALGLVVTLVARQPAAVPELLLPLTFAAAVGIASLAALVAEDFEWQEEGVMIGILLTVLVFALIQAALNAYEGAASSARLLAGSLVLAAALVVVYGVLWGGRVALRVGGVTALIALSLLAWSNGTSLSYQGGRVVRELMHPHYATSDAAKLTRNLALASWDETMDPNALDTSVAPDLQSRLGWPFRERDRLSWASPTDESTSGAVVIPSTTGKPTLGSGSFTGMPFAIAGRWQPQIGTAQNFLRWYLQRRAPVGTSLAGDIAYDQVDLYLKTNS